MGWFAVLCIIVFFSLGLLVLYLKSKHLGLNPHSKFITAVYFFLLTIANIPLFFLGLIPILFNDSGESFEILTRHYWEAFLWSLMFITPGYFVGFLVGMRFKAFHNKTYMILYFLIVLGFVGIYLIL